MPQIPRVTHLTHLRHTIALARESPPKPSNFRVGCVIVAYTLPSPPPTSLSSPAATPPPPGIVISTGYTLELPGNTHAEQCALTKLQHQTPPTTTTTTTTTTITQTPESEAERFVVLYTSLEPCGKRLSGATACVERILATRIHDDNTAGVRIDKVVFGAKEPGTFVQDSQSCRLMSEAGLEWEYLADFEGEVLRVAMEGHTQKDKGGDVKEETKKETKIDEIDEQERRRQEALPRNPKKRMMEGAPPGSQTGG